MTVDRTSDEDRLRDDLPDILRRVRQVDPNCDEDAVRRYVREIAEAEALLKELDLHDALPVAPFSPGWNAGQQQ